MAIDPTLPFKLINRYRFSQGDIGLFILFFTGACILLTIGLMFVPERTPKLPFLITGCVLLGASPFLIGPSLIFHLPDTLDIMKVGLVLGGLGKAFAMSFVIPWGCEAIRNAFPEEEEEATNKFITINCLVAPVSFLTLPNLAALLNHKFGFSPAMDVFGVILSLFAVSFIGYSILSQNKDKRVSRTNLFEEEEEEA